MNTLLRKCRKVCFVAHPLAGKDVAMVYLAKAWNMLPVSTGDYIRDYIRKHELGDTTPANMNRVSSELRKSFGSDFPVPQIMNTMMNVRRIAFSGPRVIAEVETLKRYGAIIVAVEASLDTRYKRTKDRRRIGDNVSLDQFVAFNKLEASNLDSNAHNVEAVIRMADHTIKNNGTLEEFYTALDHLMVKIES